MTTTLHNLEVSLALEYDELFSFRDRSRILADVVRDRLIQAGVQETIEVDLFDDEIEWRTTGGKRTLSIHADGMRTELFAGGPGCESLAFGCAMLVAASLDVARLLQVEVGFQGLPTLPRGVKLDWVGQAFGPIAAWAQESGEDTPAGRRLGLTWDWSNATTSHSLYVGNADDRELFLSYKVRESYLSLEDLREGEWYAHQQRRFLSLVDSVGTQMGF